MHVGGLPSGSPLVNILLLYDSLTIPAFSLFSDGHRLTRRPHRRCRHDHGRRSCRRHYHHIQSNRWPHVETTGQGGRWLANEPDCRAFKSRSMILGWKVQLAFVGYWDSC